MCAVHGTDHERAHQASQCGNLTCDHQADIRPIPSMFCCTSNKIKCARKTAVCRKWKRRSFKVMRYELGSTSFVEKRTRCTPDCTLLLFPHVRGIPQNIILVFNITSSVCIGLLTLSRQANTNAGFGATEAQNLKVVAKTARTYLCAQVTLLMCALCRQGWLNL